MNSPTPDPAKAVERLEVLLAKQPELPEPWTDDYVDAACNAVPLLIAELARLTKLVAEREDIAREGRRWLSQAAEFEDDGSELWTIMAWAKHIVSRTLPPAPLLVGTDEP